MRLNTVEPHMAKASIDVKSSANALESVPDADAVSLFFDTLASVGMSDKEAAYTMAMDPAQLSRVKSRQARLPFDAIWRLPNRFWFAFRNAIDAARGLNAQSEKTLVAERIGELVALLVKREVA